MAVPGETDRVSDVLDSAEAGGKAIRGAGFRVVGYAASLLIALAAVPFMIRHLGAVDYGYYITVSSIVFIIGGLTEAGLTALGVREYSTLAPGDRHRFQRSLIGLRFILTASGVLLAAGLAWVTGAATEVVTGTLIAGLALLIGLTQQTYAIPLMAELRIGWMTALDVIKQTVLTSVFLLAVALGAGLPAFFWAAVVAAIVLFVITLVLVRGHAPLLPSRDVSSWAQVLRETLPYAVAAAVGLIYFRIAVILMSYVSTPEETGIYSAAFRIVEVAATLPLMLVLSIFPILARAARDDQERLSYALQRVFEVSLIVGTLLAIGLAVAAPFAIDVVAGPGFEQSVGVLRLLSLALVTSFLAAIWSYGLLSLRHFRQILVVNAIAAVVAIAGTLALAPSMGADGAALATVGSEVVLSLAAAIALGRHSTALSPDLRVVPKVCFAAALAVGVALLVPAPPVVLAVLSGAVYVGAVLALRAVPPELFHALRQRGA
jgi:O-antigen/teichoic acid export membrane protein